MAEVDASTTRRRPSDPAFPKPEQPGLSLGQLEALSLAPAQFLLTEFMYVTLTPVKCSAVFHTFMVLHNTTCT